MFGVMTMHLVRLVNHGHSFEGADDLFNLLRTFPLQHSFFHLFQPNREMLPWPKPNANTQLSKFHLVEYDRVRKEVAAKFHSHIGTAQLFDVDEREGIKKKPKTTSKKKSPSLELPAPILPESSAQSKEISFPNAWGHIHCSTFSRESTESVVPSLKSKMPFQQQKIEFNRDKMLGNNEKVMIRMENYVKEREANGVYCCQQVEETTGSMCMKTYTTESGRSRHYAQENHKFPTLDLKTLVHEMHLSGQFAFSLAVGSKLNRCEFIQGSSDLDIQHGLDTPHWHDDVGHSWFDPGCYRKRTKESFFASQVLKSDLEALFMAGFIKDGPKRGANKYTPDQAQAFLRNMKLNNGRRKYSPDEANTNGALPTTTYIRSWFSRRKKKMADALGKRSDNSNEEDADDNVENEDDGLDNNSNHYKDKKIGELKKLIEERMGISARSLKGKAFFSTLLKMDDLSTGLFRDGRGVDSSYTSGYSEKALKKMCIDRNLPGDMKKDSLVKFLVKEDHRRQMQQHALEEMPQLSQIIAHSQALTEY